MLILLKFLKPFYKQSPDGVKHCNDHDSYVCKDGKPHIGDSNRSEHKTDQLDSDGKPDILVYDPQTLS